MLSNKTKRYLDKMLPQKLTNKTILITGGNSGVGFKTAETMLYLEANIILACRNISKAEAAKQSLEQEYPNSSIKIIVLDLASFSSIDNFVDFLKNNCIDIDCFINNAGTFHHSNMRTKDNMELIMGTNYFGTYYLSEKILPYLNSLNHQVTYINTISLAYKKGKINYNDFYLEKHYRNFQIYANSKLALARYTQYLVKHYQGTNIHIYLNHPGVSLTPLALNAYGPLIKKLGTCLKFLFNSPEKSSLSVTYILSNKIKEGSIIGPRGLFNAWGYPNVNCINKKIYLEIENLLSFTITEISKYTVNNN